MSSIITGQQFADLHFGQALDVPVGVSDLEGLTGEVWKFTTGVFMPPLPDLADKLPPNGLIGINLRLLKFLEHFPDLIANIIVESLSAHEQTHAHQWRRQPWKPQKGDRNHKEYRFSPLEVEARKVSDLLIKQRIKEKIDDTTLGQTVATALAKVRRSFHLCNTALPSLPTALAKKDL